MTTNEFLKSTLAVGGFDNMQLIRPRVVCNDGFVISIQASQFHYCYPRENGDVEYTHVELGYPSRVEESILKYAENDTRPTKTVYGYVPIPIVDAMLLKHGGINESASCIIP